LFASFESTPVFVKLVKMRNPDRLELHDASAHRHFSICDGTDAQFCFAVLPILVCGFAGAVLTAFLAMVLGPSAPSATPDCWAAVHLAGFPSLA
jgi:hypothetical protein